jgi:SPP1 gp7 family putative phage head morphogenesis protein
MPSKRAAAARAIAPKRIASSKRTAGRRRTATSGAPVPPANPTVLSREFFGERVPREEQWRTYYGRSLDLNRIEHALRSANCGYMRPLTDISRETVALDGHLSALLQKRLNRVAALDWDIQPATGPGVDEERAERYATFVRWQLELIPNFRDRLTDLAWGTFDGRAASEINWEAQGRQWWVRDLWWIHPRRLSFGPNRDIRVIDAWRDTGGFQDIGFPVEAVPHKFVVYRPRLFNDYQEREGLAPPSLYWSFFCRFGTRERMALLELFGKPWRIILPEADKPVNIESMNTAYQTMLNLSGQTVARMPPGFKVQVEQPQQGAGDVHDEAIDHAMKVLSKLYLGSTGTTDAVSTGLGSSIGDAHLSEEDLLIASDARRLSEAVESQLTDSIIAVNFGPMEVRHAPRFFLRTDPPLDREKEGARIQKALDIGLEVAVEEAREKLGVREIKNGEAYLKKVLRPVELGMVQQPAAPEIVYPAGTAPSPGEITDAPLVATNLPDDGGTLPPGSPPPGSLPPGGGEPPAPALPPGAPPIGTSSSGTDDSAAALAAKMTELQIAACEHGHRNRCRICGIERVRDVEVNDAGETVWPIKWRPIPAAVMPELAGKSAWLVLLKSRLREQLPESELEEFEAAPVEELRHMVETLTRAPSATVELVENDTDDDDLEDSWRELAARASCEACEHGEHITLAKQPSTVFGSPETIVEHGITHGARATGDFAAFLVEAVTGKSTARGIRAAIDAAAKRYGYDEIAETVEPELLHGCMLGALDADFEMEENTTIEVESFAALHAMILARKGFELVDPVRDTSFASRPMEQAINEFLKREVVTEAEFASMEAAAKRRAFTVARMANKEMVRTVKRELVRQLAVGADLREFGKHAAARFQSAGWTPANPSHVETIFRTNVMNAYSGGRVRQMSQPEVLEARPFWQILTVNDGPPRQRKEHRAVHGVVLRANDPFWRKAMAPFGYNCRCRVRSLSIKQGAPKVMEGTSIRDLPDAGFASGIDTLL